MRVLLAEFVHATGRIDDFLFAGEERMALRADLHAQIAAKRGARDKTVAATAGYGDFLVLGVDAGLHVERSVWRF